MSEPCDQCFDCQRCFECQVQCGQCYDCQVCFACEGGVIQQQQQPHQPPRTRGPMGPPTRGPQPARPQMPQMRERPLTEERVKEIMMDVLIETRLLKKPEKRRKMEL